MGGPRASTNRRVYAGAICQNCGLVLPPRTDGRSGERTCLSCIERALVPVTLQFGTDGKMYWASFLGRDGRAMPWSGRFRTQEKLFAIVNASYQPAGAERELERKLLNRGEGTVQLRLTGSQYARLQQPRGRG